jgi:protein SCO1/2
MAKYKAFLCMVLLVGAVLVLSGRDAGADNTEAYTRTSENYLVPDVTLVNQDGKRVKIRSLLNSRKVVILDFIYTTCTTICPVLSAEFADFQSTIGPDSGNVRLVSVSIDPENDTPKKMRDYLKRYDAKPGWDFLTGTREDILKVVKAFDAYTPSKMSHLPLAILHSSADSSWVRIYGLIGSSDMVAEYRKALK